MNITEMVSYFDTLQDKKNSVYFEDDEKELFLNRAQLILLTEAMSGHIEGNLNFSERSTIHTRGVENTLGSTDIISPLIASGMSDINGSGTKLRTTAAGVLTKSLVNQAIVYNSGAASSVMRILSFMVDNGGTYGDSAEFVRENDLPKFLKNDFLIPTNSSPVWTNKNSDYQFFPRSAKNIICSAIRYPVEMSISGVISCELNEFVHDKVVAIALELAGVGSRDMMLAELNAKINRASK
jgi:hypothetical protein